MIIDVEINGKTFNCDVVADSTGQMVHAQANSLYPHTREEQLEAQSRACKVYKRKNN
jgi:tryptophanase